MDPSKAQQPELTRSQRVQEAARRMRPGSNPLLGRKIQRHSGYRPGIASRASRAPVMNGIPSQQPSQKSQTTASQPTEPEEEHEDYPIVTTKRAMLNSLRHHVMRFVPNRSADIQKIDPCDQSQFERPIRLHRRDPRAEPSGVVNADSPAGNSTDANAQNADDKERARIAAVKAERQAEREANMAQMAPAAKTNKKKNNFRKQTEQVFQFNDSADKKKEMNIRYEEKLPWHVEDFEGKNVWRGTYETALSGCQVALLPDQGQKGSFFRMIPMEKWYKFTPKPKFKPLTIEEAEATMKKKYRDPRFLAEARRNAMLDKQKESVRGIGLFARKGERGERPTSSRLKTEFDDDDKPEAPADTDEIDFNVEEDFADDEENELFNMDDRDEKRDIQNKIKKEQQEANIFEIKEDKDYDQEEEEERRKAEIEKKQSKKTQRALMKRERNFVYEEDSEGNPYTSSSDSEDSEAERLDEEERRQKEQQQQSSQAQPEKPPATDKPNSSSGQTTKGTNTPSGTSKPSSNSTADPIKKILKRPGSPNPSEASGSESTRKKIKKKHPAVATNGTPSGSRPGSPPPPGGLTGHVEQPRAGSSLKLSLDPNKITENGSRKRKSGAGLGAASGSEGEMSDTRKRIKKSVAAAGGIPTSAVGGNAGSRGGSPNGSRPGSPLAISPPGSSGAGPTTAANAGAAQHRPKKPHPPLPSADEFRAAIPREGIPLVELISRVFARHRRNPQFNDLIKRNAHFESVGKTGMLWPLERAGEVRAARERVAREGAVWDGRVP